MECSVCYNEISAATGKVELSCAHTFHFSCLTSWFSKCQSCPLCRHEANEFETMASAAAAADDEDEDDEDEDDEDEDDEDEDDEAISLERAAAEERARHHFRLKSWDMTKVEFEGYAATRIAALVRGHQSRNFFFELKCWKEDEKTAADALKQAEKDLKQAKAAQIFYKKVSSVPRTQWKGFAATMIQSIWRSKKQHTAYQKEKLARDLAKGLRVNWIRAENGIWKRTLSGAVVPPTTEVKNS